MGDRHAVESVIDMPWNQQLRQIRWSERRAGSETPALVDKVWRRDFLLEAWVLVRRNGGAAGVDGMTVADVDGRVAASVLGERPAGAEATEG